uniref:Uncharacterized protein n=1 Tax=Fagus sylvatica TaxID=28930 RepID=A0A2N9I4E9_FAGSY
MLVPTPCVFFAPFVGFSPPCLGPFVVLHRLFLPVFLGWIASCVDHLISLSLVEVFVLGGSAPTFYGSSIPSDVVMLPSFLSFGGLAYHV